MSSTGSVKNLRFELYPGAQTYTFFSGTNLTALAPNTNFFLAPYITGYTLITNLTTNGSVIITVTNFAYEWRLTNATAASGFYRVGVTPISSNAALTATVLNRLAYGPTPDELERVTSIGPQAYINEQVNFDGIPETFDNYIIEATNSIPFDQTTNWTYISLTGTVQNTTFYLFTTQPGDIYVDDIQLRPFVNKQIISTNAVYGTNVVDGTNVYTTNLVYSTNIAFSHIGTNVLINSDFESPFAAPWTKLGGASASDVASGVAHGGNGSLHVISTTGAATAGNNYVRQIILNTYLSTNSNGDVYTNILNGTTSVVLNYWYLPSVHSTKLRLQLGSGINSTPGGLSPAPGWVYATATGAATATPHLYLYLSGAGDCYMDDIKLVAGSTPEVGPNLLQNGNFETALTPSWTSTVNFASSAISSTVTHSGNGSLHLIATAAGAGNGNSTFQNIPSLVSGQTYTVSYWYLPSPNRTLTVRLSGALLNSTPDVDISGLNRRLNTARPGLSDYRAWWCLHAVQSQRQLFEVMSQFWENHFVTQYTKSKEYFLNLGYDDATAGYLATDWEFREMTKWRNAMLNPNCTFFDLLRISAESPAMIVYLDSVNSTGNAGTVANENYGRELLELFTMGVDNGYDQTDIVVMSRAWTGWSVQLVDPGNANNPFAPASITYYPNTNNASSKVNIVGTWAFNYKAGSHGTNRAPLFAGKTVPARFGPPWAGNNYQLNIPARATGTTNSIQDGYDVIAHLANQPFTEEYISVKLCRLFVHDGFPNPNTSDPTSAGYAFYDYTNPDRSAEAELVHQCMLAWENSTPKGNLRAVLNTIFNSDLFRSHTAAAQKVKTPFEFVASSVRALRSVNPNGTATATTDGYGFASPMDRMGTMGLFDRTTPDGYPEVAEPWISSGTLVERIRFIQTLCNPGTGSDAGNNDCDVVGLLKKKLPAGNWNNAGAVADYFLGILYPGEGAGNLSLYRNAAVNYLNSDDTGTNATPSTAFSALGNATSGYTNRVSGMASMLMTFQRFQEQ